MKEDFRFHLPTSVHFGIGVLDTLPDLLRELRGHIFLLAGNHLFQSPLYARLLKLLDGFSVDAAPPVPPNPSPSSALTTSQLAREKGAEIILAVGGGSVIDMAKAVALLANEEELLRYLREGVPPGTTRLPLVAIPTTAGTGSEVTPWATLWDWERRRKYSLEGPGLFPDLTLVDPTLTLSLPPSVTMASGLDALSHAVEACWSRNRNPISTLLALEAVRGLAAGLPRVRQDPQNLKARSEVSQASLYAGLAFSQTKTAAAHALSYPLTLLYQVPHGVACSITLPPLLPFNTEAAPEAASAIARALGAPDTEAGGKALSRLLRDAGHPMRLSALGLGEGDVEALIQDGAYPERMGYNPRPLSREDIKKILMSVF